MKAYLKNYRQSPRKVRVVSDLVKGRSVAEAMAQLGSYPKRVALPLKKLIDSAVANAAHNFKKDKDNLIVKNITVDKGVVLKRFMPVWHGSAHPIHKHTSNVTVELAEAAPKAPKKK